MRFLCSCHPERSEGSAVRLFFALAISAASLPAQDPGPYARAVETWISLPAAPGYERYATDRIQSASTGWTRDGFGNLLKTSGVGSPRRMVACGLDDVGFAVSEITDDGYVRVHHTGVGSHVRLWDQFHEGQRAFILTSDHQAQAHFRPVGGAFAVRSNHLWRGRPADTSITSIENLWLDVGARSRGDAERLGIRVLDPVFRDAPQWSYADFVAGPEAGNRAGCESVAAAADAGRPASGETVFIVSVQRSYGWQGLTGAIAALGRIDTLVIVDDSLAGARTRVASHQVPSPPWRALPGLDIGAIVTVGTPVSYSGTLVESVREQDLETLHQTVARLAGLEGDVPKPLQLADGWVPQPPILVRDSLTRYADLLGKLTDTYAVSGHEEPMRQIVRQSLPAWARDSAVVDSSGNLIVSMGPDRDTLVIMAHLDEIGFEVTRIHADGTVSLRPRGTFFSFLWEGQPALLHRADDQIPARDGKQGCGATRGGPLRGVFIPRDSASRKDPSALTATFGLDSAGLVAAGVSVGSPLTGFKCSARIGEYRFTARSIDDRAGDVALLSALDDIEPSKLDHKVLFVWTTREEIGLEGAKELAARLRTTVHRVHAVDTFVSSDSPLESHRFGDAPLGQGAVVRAIDNSDATPPDEVDRLIRLARAAGIPLQAGITNGGNDGSEFMRWGIVNAGIAWPLRYSHSPAEIIDLRDLRSMARIVAAAAKAPTQPKTPPTKP